MQYRTLGKTNFKTSLLGLGCMRLPFIDDDGQKGVDRAAAIELIRYAANNGINYFDTAMTYHGGESEAILGEALDGGLREKVWITTKQPQTENRSLADIRRNLENTLKKLRTGYIDMYLFHRITPANWATIQERKLFAEFERFKAEGLIRHIGFSYHGDYATFANVAKRYPWDMCMGQHNLLDIRREISEDGPPTAGKHGVALAIMEPLKGGGLVYAPGPVQTAYDSYPVKRTPAEWAFRYLVDKPEISVILSGMSNMEQLKENIAIFSQPDMVPGCLTDKEKAVIAQAREGYESIVTIPCTECNYCVPCPAGIQIPVLFGAFNDAHRFGHLNQPMRRYWFVKNAGGASDQCTGCGECVPKCPQLIDVPQELQVVRGMLDGWTE